MSSDLYVYNQNTAAITKIYLFVSPFDFHKIPHTFTQIHLICMWAGYMYELSVIPKESSYEIQKHTM